MPYPLELESWWRTTACRVTGSADPCQALQRLEGAAARLSDRFTVDRPTAFREYASDPLSLAAYGVLFFPQTFARVTLVIEEWRTFRVGMGDPFGRSGATADDGSAHAGSPDAAPPHSLRILDLGSGSGASSLAAAAALRGHPLALTAVDHAPAALAALRQVFDDCHALWPTATLTTQARDVRADGLPGAFDLILASFVLNELFPDGPVAQAETWLRSQLARLAPGGSLVVVEPAGSATCERLQHLRDRFSCDEHFTIVAPCPHRLPCPLLGANCGFCHDVRAWRVPDSVNLINRRMFRSVQDLKHGLLVLRREPLSGIETPATIFRLVAPMNRAKGRLVTRGCCSDGTLREIELMTRGLTRAQIDGLAARERGERLRMINARLLGDGRTWRAEALEPLSISHTEGSWHLAMR